MLTIRQIYAGQFLTSGKPLDNKGFNEMTIDQKAKEIARQAFILADAMIEHDRTTTRTEG